MSRGERAATYDKERIHLNLARLKKGGQIFEIDIDPDLAISFKQGKDIDIKDIVKAEKIFSDVKKGLLASETSMNSLFNTENELDIAKIILQEGEIQLTAEHRSKLREDKRRKIINIIHRNGVDPRTNAPHPVTRIENAFEQVKVKVDELKSAEDQVQNVLKVLMTIMPIKFEVKEIQISVQPQYASKSQTILKKFGKVLNSTWGSDGSFVGVVEIPGGLEEEFYDKLNSISHGSIESKIIKIR